MKTIVFFTFILSSLSMFSQDYSFFSKSTKKIQGKEYIDYLNSNFAKVDSISKTTSRFLENGTSYNQLYLDSITKSKEGYRYATKYYRDTISNKFSFVLYKRSKTEFKESNEYFNEYIKADGKNRKKLKNSYVGELTLKDIKNEVHTLETLKNKIIVLDFWFINCSACVKEMPNLNNLKAEFENEDIEWFAVTYDPKDRVQKFLEKIKFDYKIIPDSKYLTDRFDIKFYPTTLIIDEEQKIVFTGKFGFTAGRVEEIKKVLQKLIKDKKYNLKVGPLLETTEN